MRLKSISEKGADERPARRTAMRLAALSAAPLLASLSCVFESKGMPSINDGPSAEARLDNRAAPDTRPDSALPDAPGPDGRGPDSKIVDKGTADNAQADKNKKPDSLADSLASDIPKPDAKGPCPSATTGTFSGLIGKASPQTVGGYSFGYTGFTTGDAYFDISCGGSALFTNKAFPFGIQTQLDITQDSKKLKVIPNYASASQVSVVINVENL